MKNIMKALRYQTLRDNVTYYIVIGLLAMFGATLYSETDGLLNLTGSEYASRSAIIYSALGSMVILLFTTRIFGWDYTDKTLNYEILIGHSRKEAFWGRVWVSLSWALPFMIVVMFVPLLLVTALNGWGIYSDMSNMIIRWVLSVFPMFRLFCECVLLTTLLKNCYLGLVIGFLLTEIAYSVMMAIEEMAKIELGLFSVIQSTCNMDKLISCPDYTFEYINGKDEMVFVTEIDPVFAVLSVAVSLVVGIGCLVLAYRYFRKTDLN